MTIERCQLVNQPENPIDIERLQVTVGQLASRGPAKRLMQSTGQPPVVEDEQGLPYSGGSRIRASTNTEAQFSKGGGLLKTPISTDEIAEAQCFPESTSPADNDGGA